ncbi:MAG: RdgB/HAM1 family non-canonical purine NTP pyrophosphatase [bacterium]|nr:RdgB/HAM1 family non-canonical purine NTP pyrophosphatase [bacterium]
MKTYVATKNAGKLAELVAIFAGRHLDLATYDGYADVAEGEAGYVENARLKAHALMGQLREAGIDAAVLADDSGLEVDALDGRPGVLSARYAGANATWPQRRAALCRELDGLHESERGAHFVSVLVLLLPTGEEIVAEGIVNGRITEGEHGEHGFGYDPIFFYPPSRRTFAQMTDAEKNRLSHRRRAADALLEALVTK